MREAPNPSRKEAPDDARALVAIDLGAESCRISLLRWMDGIPVVILVHRFVNTSQPTATGLRWDLQGIEAGLEVGLRLAAELAPEGIRALAVDGWAVDYVRLGEDGSAVADPFCYRDERTIASEKALHQRIPQDRLRELTGVAGLRLNTIYQLSADSAEDKARRWLNLPEYVLTRLGGRAVAEFTNATHTQMVDFKTGEWSAEIVAAVGLDGTLNPEIVRPGTVVGRLGGPLARLAAYADTVLIAPAAHDTASAVAGIPAMGEDWAYISSGTWSLVGTQLAAACNHAAARADNFTNLGSATGGVCFHKNVNGMWLIRQCVEYWAAEGTDWAIPDLIAAAERQAAPDVILDVDDTELLLPGRMPARINAQLERRGLPMIDACAANAPVFANLIFHSLAARYAEVLARIEEHTGKRFKRLFLVGGGSKNLYLNRLTAAATGLAVRCGAQESSTLGNFAVQLASLEAKCAIDNARIAHWAFVLENVVVQTAAQV